MPVPPFSSLSIKLHVSASLALCVVLAYAMHVLTSASHRQVEQAREALRHAKSPASTATVVSVESRSDVRWSATLPERAAIDALTQAMSDQATVNGLVLRTLSLSHSATSDRAWGQVSLEVAASGRYADLKNWQGSLLSRFPSLAVQSLRLQPLGGNMPMMGGGAVEAQVAWVLYVRD